MCQQARLETENKAVRISSPVAFNKIMCEAKALEGRGVRRRGAELLLFAPTQDLLLQQRTPRPAPGRDRAPATVVFCQAWYSFHLPLMLS